MALKRATKSIPLNGGIAEEADDFLLEPTGMQYMQNLRFTKIDTAEKTRPLDAGTPAQISNYTPDTYGLWARGNNVAVVGNNEVSLSRDGGASFSPTAQDTDLLGIEAIIRTAEQAGGNNFSWAPVGNYTAGSPDTYDILAYVVAFERITLLTSVGINTREVVVHVYSLDGQLLEETVFPAPAFAPQVKPADGSAQVAYVNGAGDIVTHSVLSGTLSLGAAITTNVVDVRQYCQQYNNVDFGYGGIGTPLSFDEMRLGYSRDLRLSNGAFDMFYEPTTLIGAVAWKTDTSAQIQVQAAAAGITTGPVGTIFTDTGLNYGKLLDVSVDSTYIYVLWADVATTAASNQTDINCTRYTLAMGAPLTLSVATGINAEPVNGSVRSDSNGDVHIAYTLAEGDPTDNQYVTQGNHRIEWSIHSGAGWPTPALLQSDNIYSQRLCSDIAIDRNDVSYFCVQQWDNWNPGSGGAIPSGVSTPAFTPTHRKPLTTALVSTHRSGVFNRLHGTFDAGQSKACLPGSDEQSIHMSGDLYYWDQGAGEVGAHQFWYGNRVVLNASDDFYFASTNAGSVTGSDARTTLEPGASRFACYRLQSSVPVPSVNFSDGMFMGTAIPTWFDGSVYLGSMAPIESPEVVSWQGDGDAGSYMLYQDLGAAGAEAKVVQAVAGYYDDSGRVHRSAPSAPVYLGNMLATSTTGRWISVFVTPPLGLARNRPYFIETYESFPGGVPQLAATRHIPANSATDRVAVQWASNLDPMAAVNDLDVTDFRSAKTIYTAGNVLAADPWPNFDAVVRSGRRLFAHSISDPSTIYYSKIFESGVAPEFSAALTVSIGNETITALGAIDDKVVIFTDSECWIMYGTGPDNTGANGDFFIEKMVFQHGCVDQDSILTYEEGIAFYSSTTGEFYTLGRDLQLIDLGENVKLMSERITDIRAAIVAPFDHELRWYCDQTPGPEYLPDSAVLPAQPPRPFLENQPPANAIFTYNYKYKKWSIVEEGNLPFQRVVVINNRVGGVAGTNFLFKRENDVDWKFSNLSKWQTPWIKINQLQDFGRFYGLTFLGKYLSSWQDVGGIVEAGDLQVTIRYDYEGAEATTSTYRWRANQDYNPESGDRLQFVIRPKRQKCQAIKIYIEEIPTERIEVWEPVYTNGQGYLLTAVDVHYGAKGGSGDKSLGAARRKG